MTARVHVNEAYHQINDLPPLAEEFKSGEKLNAVEFAKSLGLDTSIHNAASNVNQ